ncbi:putative glycosidase [Dioscorea sansibarensis]
MAMMIRCKPILHLLPREKSMFPHHETRRLKCSTPIRSLIPAAAIFFNPISFGNPNRSRFLPIVRDGLVEAPSVAEPELIFSETFPLIRTKMVEGKVTVRLDPGEGEGSVWRLVVGCDLEGKWTLHWGVTYCDELGSEWDQPPLEMRPPGSIAIKDYAIETPMKKSSSSVEGRLLNELQINFNDSTSISAIHFVLKEEESGAWFQHKGRDFRVPLMGYINGDEKAAYLNGDQNKDEGKQSFSIWPGALDQISSLLLNAEGPQSKGKDADFKEKPSMKQSRHNNGFYEEYSISKEEKVKNTMTVTVRKSNETDKNLVYFETDLLGDVTIHWGVCRDNSKKWEIPPTPHPPATKNFRSKALQTSLQHKKDGLGCWGSFLLDKDTAGLLFVLKLNEYVWLNDMGTDFYIPLISMSSLPSQTSRDFDWTKPYNLEKSDAPVVVHPFEDKSLEFSTPEIKDAESKLPEDFGKTKEESLTVDHATYTAEIINEIRNLVTDISSEKGKSTKTKEAQENILQEIEKLAAEAYSIFRSSTPTFEESVLDVPESLEPSKKVSSGTGSGYEILCQGFNWESHKSGRWYSELSAKASELSSLGFTVVWLPPPTESVSPEGYMPKDLYNLNSRYGNMEELKDLVGRFHEVGIRVLGDVVLNHRCAHYKNANGIWNIFGGHLNWDDRAVVADDPHFQGRGNKSSGDNFHAAPNIDHSQDFVRKDLKEWLCWLRKEVGYDGWRLDFVRGFWGGYVKDYLEASEPYFAVGEYWDSLSYTYGEMDHNQDAHRQRIIDWINATNGTAGAFDVTTKGILHAALERCEYWRLSDSKGKPPGVVGWWPSRAITFIENHDTGSTQGHWRFPAGKEMQGYAYILTHPGTPAVFYDHIFSHHQQEISRIISLRNRNKINCRSVVKITKAERDVYAAEIDEKVIVKIGPGYYEPAHGPKQWVVVAEGKDYKIWEAS